MTFGQTLRAARVGAELSQDDLAFLLNVAPSTVSQYERDLMAPSREVFTLIQSFLDELASVAFPGHVEAKNPGGGGGGEGRHNYPARRQESPGRIFREYGK